MNHPHTQYFLKDRLFRFRCRSTALTATRHHFTAGRHQIVQSKALLIPSPIFPLPNSFSASSPNPPETSLSSSFETTGFFFSRSFLHKSISFLLLYHLLLYHSVFPVNKSTCVTHMKPSAFAESAFSNAFSSAFASALKYFSMKNLPTSSAYPDR